MIEQNKVKLVDKTTPKKGEGPQRTDVGPVKHDRREKTEGHRKQRERERERKDGRAWCMDGMRLKRKQNWDCCAVSQLGPIASFCLAEAPIKTSRLVPWSFRC